MDGHLAKPIDSRQLVENLLLHIGRSQKIRPPRPAQQMARSAGILDRDSRHRAVGRRRRELYRSMLPMFPALSRTRHWLSSYRRATGQKDLSPVLHNLRGMASTMGATAFATAARGAARSSRPLTISGGCLLRLVTASQPRCRAGRLAGAGLTVSPTAGPA